MEVIVHMLGLGMAMAMLMNQVTGEQLIIVGEDGLRRTIADDLMVFAKHDDAVGDLFDNVEVVRCRDDGVP